MEDSNENIKKAFQKVKEDISDLSDSIRNINEHVMFLHGQLSNLSSEIQAQREDLSTIIDDLKSIKNSNSPQSSTSTQPLTSTDRQSSTSSTSTHNPAHNLTLEDLKSQYLDTSIGNRGVSTDRQTDRQTDNPALRQTDFEHKNTQKNNSNLVKSASQLFDSLDTIKKDLRRKFKQITDQEFLVFTTIYQLEESNQYDIIDYSLLATTLNLTESSIRDYISRLIKKDLPLEKLKVNNKRVSLSISPNLKKIASLSTILAIRET